MSNSPRANASIAIYNFMQLAHYHRAYPSEPGHLPVLKELHCYGWSLCGGLHIEEAALWRQLGWDWRFVLWDGHETVEAQYDGRWHLSGSGVLSALTAKLGKASRGQRALNLSLIEMALTELGKGVPIIVLDDAQNLAYGSLEEVRLLLGLNLAEPPAFGLILIGDEYLLGSLRLRQHRSLFSRIACQVSLSPWTSAQVGQYLQQSFAAVGINRNTIEPAALNLLTSASGGLARTVCLLARAAWMEAATAGAQTIEPAHVQAAIERVPGVAGLSLPPATAIP
jgi:type II secretory pathway predicted ATPase ExeA